MEFNEFKYLTDLMCDHHKKISSLSELGVNLWDVIYQQERLVNGMWRHILKEEGYDWFNWFMYEKEYIKDKVGKKHLKANDNGKPICKNLRGLYTYLKKNNYFNL